MESKDSLNKIFSDVVSDYFSTFDVLNPVIPNYQIAENIASSYLELRSDVVEQSLVSIEALNSYNGFAVPPKTVDGKFTVLINKNVLMENIQNKRMDWVGTIVHETTHVQDFTEYANILGVNGYLEILQISKQGMFNLWTEIHARSNGYYFTRKYTVGEEYLRSKELIPDITNREIPGQSKILFERYHATQNGFEQAYLVAQYIGRLYTLQKLYPKIFTDAWITDHFGVNAWMAEWFYFYKKYPILKDASEHFEEMKIILRQNFNGI